MGIKKPLKQLNSMHFSHIFVRAKNSINELLTAKNLVLNSGMVNDDLKLLREKTNKLSED